MRKIIVICKNLTFRQQRLATFIGGLGLGLFYDWRFALSILAFLPVVAIGSIVMFLSDVKTKRAQAKSYEDANVIAEETFTSIRTVAAFGREEFHIQKYLKTLNFSKIRRRFLVGS